MTEITRKMGKACVALALLALGCGGRTLDAEGGAGDNDTDGGTTGTPTCGEICRRAVDSCFPGGVIDQCVSDCDKTRSQYKDCSGLDTLMRCRMMGSVRCSTNQVIFEGCTSELNELVRCKS